MRMRLLGPAVARPDLPGGGEGTPDMGPSAGGPIGCPRPRSLARRRSVGDQDFGRTYALGANKRKQRGSLGGRKPHTAVRRTSPKRACRVAGVDRVTSIREKDGVGHRSIVPLLGIVHLGKVERPESSCRRLVVRSPG